jgi:hypothetical protein
VQVSAPWQHQCHCHPQLLLWPLLATPAARLPLLLLLPAVLLPLLRLLMLLPLRWDLLSPHSCHLGCC